MTDPDPITQAAAKAIMRVSYQITPSRSDPSAEEYAAVVVAAVTPLIRAHALRDAADAWQQGQWADAPRRTDRVAERIANGQYVGDWLRTRANQEGHK